MAGAANDGGALDRLRADRLRNQVPPPGLGPGLGDLPGVPDTSGDEDKDMQPRPKRGKEAEDSPKKKRENNVTLTDIQKLLEMQSKILQDHQTTQMKQAVAELRESTGAQINTIKAEVSRHGDYISQLRDQGERMEARIAALETNGAAGGWGSRGSTGDDGEKVRKNVMIFGGWGPDTRREDLLAELHELLKKLDLFDTFEDIFTTGPRRGNALAVVRVKPGETDQELKKRILTMIQAIRVAQVSSQSMEAGKNLWASLSKTKQERLRSSHAGKMKRLVLEIDEGEKTHLDVEWSAGSLWIRGKLLGSATRPKPHGITATPGKMPGSWIDTAMLGRVLGCSEADLKERWEALVQV